MRFECENHTRLYHYIYNIHTYKKGIVQLAMFEDTVPGNRKLVDIAPTRNQPWKSSSCFA